MTQVKKNTSNSHRGHFDIIADILLASYNGTRKTYLMYHCNMSSKQLKGYLDFLLRKELLRRVTEERSSNRGLFKITGKGNEFLRTYKSLKALVE